MLRGKIFLTSMLLVGMLFLFEERETHAQDISLKRSHRISSNSTQAVPTTGTLNVIAIMVEFQPDSNRLTSGTGVFGPGGLPYLERNPTNIDPLPHNQAYFESHLEFAKNYFEKASDGQLNINYRVLPDVYRLDKSIRDYSPTGENFTFEKLAELSRDAWTKVDENGGFDATGLNPDETAFIIFHAGIGRDIELVGTTLDITPQDIPSIYLNTADLGSLLNDPSFDGFEMNGGSFRVTNSLILPRTETRRGVDVLDNEFVFPLSVNGLLCASIGSHLGLPDLFNPETGESGIGQFGLMDGAGFFAYRGLFPPEPSAWEKQKLGWITPFEIEPEIVDSVFLPAAALNDPGAVARYSLSRTEYFLIENRHRDPELNGVEITIRQNNGNEVTQTFLNSNDTFVFQENGFDDLFEEGVVIDVDNPDWALPGGLDVGEDEQAGTQDDRFLNGGILIWHIDEAVIQNQANGVNRNELRRGVDLEEADGSQDIGRPVQGLLDNSASFGSPFDFWWSGNDFRVLFQGNEIRLYNNEFSPESFPDNSSNSGARSYFRFYDFSGNLPVASFRVEELTPEGNPELVLDVSYTASESLNPSDAMGTAYPLAITGNSSDIILPHSNGLIIYNTASESVSDTTGLRAFQPLFQELVFGSFQSGSSGTEVIPFRKNGSSWQPEPGAVFSQRGGLLSSQTGDTLTLDGTTAALSADPFTAFPDYYPEPVQSSKIIGGEQARNLPGAFVFGPALSYPKNGSSFRSYVGALELDGGRTGFFILEDERLILVDPGLAEPFNILYEGNSLGWPAIVDWDHDGAPDFIFVDYELNQLIGLNNKGTFLDYFPLDHSGNERFAGTPLIADLDGNEELDLIISSQDDFSYNLRVFDHQLAEQPFSPLYAGGVTVSSALPVNPAVLGDTLVAFSQSGDLKGWQFEGLRNPVWSTKYGNDPFNKVTGRLNSGSTISPEFTILNENETYNWPNPADQETNIRFQVKEPGGTVEIHIVTLSGRRVYQRVVQTAGGAPEEIRLDTSRLGSGGYYALIKATVNGRSESKLVKIAVVH